MRYEGGQYYVKSEEEMKGLFPYAWEAVENTQAIADRCNVEIEFGVTKLPHFEVPDGYTSETYLYQLCEDGLAERRAYYESHLDEVRQMFDERFVRMWDLYLSACAATFHNGIIDLHQILFTKGVNNDLPMVRRLAFRVYRGIGV